jgi:ATP adenylyltransferase
MERLYAPWRMAYVDQPSKERHPAGKTGCIFCDKAAAGDDVSNLIVHRGVHCFVLMNLFPYNNGHLMIAPYRHTAVLASLDTAESLELLDLAKQAQAALVEAFHPQGYNLGMNLGEVAGAGIADHLHLHIVPRWNGDTNFMPVLADVKVMPDSLENTALKIRQAWPEAASLPANSSLRGRGVNCEE